MEDEAIIALFHARSEQAISELIAKHGAAVRGITANILRDPLDVEECANDTYWRIWNRIPPEVPKSLRAFACSIARNAALNRFHSNTAQKRNSFYDVALDEGSEREPETLHLQAVGAHFLCDRVLFVERANELRYLARLST